MNRSLLVAAAAALLLTATACTTSGQEPAATSSASAVASVQPSAADSAVSVSSSTSSTATAATTPLYARLDAASAAGQTGTRVDQQVDGQKVEATGIWIGCDGTPATATYDLDDDFASLTGDLVLADPTPARVEARVDFVVDGKTVHRVQLTAGTDPTPVTIDLKGAKILTVSAISIAGDCSTSDLPYGAFVGATLTAGK